MYAVVPEHPKATKNHYVLLHRIIMENSLGRMLKDNEVVHHKDHNKKNNSLDNLELLNAKEHVSKHGREHGRQMVVLQCPWCKKLFTKPVNTTFIVKHTKYNCCCCSPHCRGKLYQYIQKHGVTSAVQEAIDNNFIARYRRYLES